MISQNFYMPNFMSLFRFFTQSVRDLRGEIPDFETTPGFSITARLGKDLCQAKAEYYS